MTGQMLSTKHTTPHHGRVQRLPPSDGCDSRHSADWLNFHHRLGTTRSVGFRVVFPWPVWPGWRFLALSRLVSSHFWSLVGDSRPAHVAKPSQFYPNSCCYRCWVVFLIIPSWNCRFSPEPLSLILLLCALMVLLAAAYAWLVFEGPLGDEEE